MPTISTVVHYPPDLARARPKLRVQIQPEAITPITRVASVIELTAVTKQFNTLKAVDGLSLIVPRGEIVGLLGPNGAGKTTLLKLIAGIYHPDEGSIRPTGTSWPLIGFKSERLLFPNRIRVGQYLVLVAGLSNIPKSEVGRVVFDSLTRVRLLSAIDKRIRNISKGMRQRLGIAQVLIGNPQLLLLDEPSDGLDPGGQDEINQCVRALHASGKTIILSSHQLEQVTDVCTQLVIMNRGQIHYQNATAAALGLRPFSLIRTDRDVTPLLGWLKSLHPEIEVDGQEIVLRNEAMALRRQILTTLLYADYDIIQVRQQRTTLAEIYAEAVK